MFATTTLISVAALALPKEVPSVPWDREKPDREKKRAG
jgi:hypothetical protein